MRSRVLLFLLPLLLAFSAPASARGGGTLDSILPEIRAQHPGRMSDAEPFTAPDGSTHYRIKWMTPEGRILYFDADARNGRYSNSGDGDVGRQWRHGGSGDDSDRGWRDRGGPDGGDEGEDGRHGRDWNGGGNPWNGGGNGDWTRGGDHDGGNGGWHNRGGDGNGDWRGGRGSWGGNRGGDWRGGRSGGDNGGRHHHGG